MSLLQQFKRVFRKLTPTEVAAAELADAELSKLEHQTATEFSDAMTQYQSRRIARLRAFLATQAEKAAP
jgi:hypothetical protein